MTASRTLVGRGSVYTIATATQLLAALLAQPALTRLLPVAEYGRVALAIVVTQLVGMVVTAGLPAVITREHFLGRGHDSVLEGGKGSPTNGAGSLVTLSIVVAVLVGGLVHATGPLWAAPVGGYDVALTIAVATGVAFAVIQSGQAIQRARGEAGRFVVVVAVNALGGQLLGVAVAATVAPTAVGYLTGVAVGTTAAALLGTVWARPSLARLTRVPVLLGWFAIALPTVPHLGAMYLMSTGDRYVLTTLGGDATTAAYTVAYTVGSLGIVLVNAANNAWAPLVYAAPEETRWQVLAETTRTVLRLAALAAAGIAFTAPLGLLIVAPADSYALTPLVPVVALTAAATVPMVLYLASVHVVFWSGRTAALLWIAPVAVTAALTAKALLFPRAGLLGVAAVTVVAFALLAALVAARRRGLATVPWTGRWVPVVFALVACGIGAVLPPGAFGYAGRALGTVVVLALLVRELRGVFGARSLAFRPGARRAP